MKVGNLGQAVILSVVAIAAVAFLFIQLKGRHAPATQSRPVNSGITPSIHTASLELPRTVYGDPFTHPALPRRLPPKKEAKKPAGETSALGSGGGLSGSLPYPIDGPAQASPEAADKGAKKPVDDGKDTILLAAVVSEPRAVAFFSINAQPNRSYEVGESITKHAKVASIGQGSVVLQLATGRRVLFVGGTTKL